MSTHNLCFGAKIRKIDITLHTPVLLYIKVGFKGVFIAGTCFRDGTVHPHHNMPNYKAVFNTKQPYHGSKNNYFAICLFYPHNTLIISQFTLSNSKFP